MDMTSNLFGKCTIVKFYYCHNFGKVEGAYNIKMCFPSSVGSKFKIGF